MTGEEEFEHDLFHTVVFQTVGAILLLSIRFCNMSGEESSRFDAGCKKITPLSPLTLWNGLICGILVFLNNREQTGRHP